MVNPDHVSSGVASVEVDGIKQDGNVIKTSDKSRVAVKVVLGNKN